MRVVTSIACLLATASLASAEPRRTLQAVTLRKIAGEKEAAVGQVPADTEVTVLAEEGRWVKVRVGKLEGYVTRTTLTDAGPPTGGAAHAWSASRHPDGSGAEVTALFIIVTAPAGALQAQPGPTAPKVADVAKGAHLTVLDAGSTPGWLHASDDAGHQGWIRRELVDNGATGVTLGADLQGSALRDDFTRAPQPKVAIRADLGVGYRSLGMDFSSNAQGGLTNYLVDADAVATGLDVDVRAAVGPRAFVGGAGRVEVSSSSPGIAYAGPTSAPGKIPFRTLGTDLDARVGVHLKDAVDLAVTAGGHYDVFFASDVNNAGMLPRERLVGATVGVRADIVPRRSRISATARFQLLALGSRAQTAGLQDGTASTAHAVWGGATVRYQLGRRLAAFAAYDFGRATTDWTGPSMQTSAITSASRVDTTQLLQLGVSASL